MVHIVPSLNATAVIGHCYPRFEVHADRSPQALARVIDVLAAQALIPSELQARQSCGGLWLAFHLDVEDGTAERLAEKCRAIVSVQAVVLILVTPKPAGRSPDTRLSAHSFEALELA